MHMQTRPEYRGELGWREALAAKRLPRSGVGGPRTQCVCVGVGGGTPDRRERRAGGLTGASAGRAASPAQYWREAR
jgi:hypothetical protein